jgi:sugar lactone lactonase YvrE
VAGASEAGTVKNQALLLIPSALASMCFACSSSDNGTDASAADATSSDAGTQPSDSGVTDAGVSDGSINRGPYDLLLQFDPNGLFWDPASSTLYLADEADQKIMKWRDSEGLSMYAQMPQVSANTGGLGQLVRTADGKLLTPRFGFGNSGGIWVVSADSSTTTLVPGLDVVKRRLGLAIAPDMTIYEAYFFRTGNGPRVGAVGTVTLAGQENMLLSGFGKPVGAAFSGGALYVSDQDNNAIVKVTLGASTSSTAFAQAMSPDLISTGPNGDFFTGSKVGNVYRISSTGAVSNFATGLQQPRGVVYDAANQRVFVADHDGDPSNGTTHYMRIRPVN